MNFKQRHKTLLVFIVSILLCKSLIGQTKEFDGYTILGDFEIISGQTYTYTILNVDSIGWTWESTSGLTIGSEVIKTFTNSQGFPSVTVKWTKPKNESYAYVLAISPEGTWVFLTVNFIEYPEPISLDQNYVKTTSYKDSGVSIDRTDYITSDRKNESITYFDGIGRPIQEIKVNAAGGQSGLDIVTPITYDAFGRQTKSYLPYPINAGNNANVRQEAIKEVHDYYNTEKYELTRNPYSEKYIEVSPLNRVLKQAAPGKEWRLKESLRDFSGVNDHTIKFEYSTNYKLDNVRCFKVSFIEDNTENPQLVDNGNYTPKKLYKTITKDENWKSFHGKNRTTEEYKNKQGQIILKRTYNTNVAHDTYYVYDDFGNLTYVLPPKVNIEDGVSAEELSELCYQYIYDKRNRLVQKKIPGKAWEYIVYDKLDRPVLTQDANLRFNTSQANKWLFTKYDVFGRVAYTGVFTHSTLFNQAEMQNYLDAYYNNSELKIYENKLNTENNNHYYSNQSFPNTNLEVLTVNYYDNYAFSIPVSIKKPTIVWETGDISNNTKDLATGSKIKVLNTNQWITSVTVYDKKARPTWLASYNEFLVTTDIVKSKLTFTGIPTKTVSIHKKQNQEDIVVTDTYEYDHMQRLISQYQSISGVESTTNSDVLLTAPSSALHLSTNSITLKPGFIGLPGFNAKINDTDNLKEELIVVNTYDELGQLKSKKVGGTVDENRPPRQQAGLQTIDYTYNIRGWLKGINDNVNTDNTLTLANNDLFGFKINYNNPTTGTALYNGNISETLWKTANTDNTLKSYNYQYDALNRITAAIDNTNNYNLNNIAYDKNGNITELERKGHINTNATQFGVMDMLNYTYHSGNKLTAVIDQSNNTEGFKDGNTTGDDYTYDANGNMITDKNKGIASITYNHLNLPTKVDFGFGNSIDYIYDATGIKQAKSVNRPMSNGRTTTFYAGNYIYKTNRQGIDLKFFNHPEGYVEPNGNKFDYIYQYKDHLGNIRLSYKDSDGNGTVTSSEILEENNYYPFGLKHKGYNNNIVSHHPYKDFQGQELTEDLGLNVHEWKYRISDPAIGRFWQVDPLAEDYLHNGVYNFSENRVIDAVELEGLEAFILNNRGRKATYTNNVHVDNYLKDKVASGSLSVSEAEFVGMNQYGAYKARDNKGIASRFAANSGLPTDPMNPNVDDSKDAIRHSLWSALNTQTSGEDFARGIGVAHELGNKYGMEQMGMDLANNEVGIAVALANPDADVYELMTLLLDKLANGDLLVINPNTGQIEKSNLNDKNVEKSKNKTNNLYDDGDTDSYKDGEDAGY